MGFESFRVELRGGSASYDQVDAAVRSLSHARPDHVSIASQASTYYTIEDGRHAIEVEVAISPVRISCRFTLCHPPSITAAFLDLIRELMTRFGMDARICDDVPPEPAPGFSADRFPEFADVLSRCVAARRAEWVANFGPEQFPARTQEAYQRFILPRCEPVG
jgi:hypothetical protein